MGSALMPILWVAVALFVLLILQRWIHAHLHGVSLLLTGRPEWAVVVYAIVLFPGVLLHELSHWLTATLLGVRTGSMSLTPRRQPDGSLQLGYVEYYKGKNVGAIRESLIGAAPLIAGTAAILLISLRIFSVTDLSLAVQTGDVDILAAAMADFLETPFILLWIYLIFAISNAMLPSKSDRVAWPAFLLIMLGVALFLYLIGLQERFLASVAQPVAVMFGYLGTAFSVAIAVDILFVVAIMIIESILSRVRGMSVSYGNPPNEESAA